VIRADDLNQCFDLIQVLQVNLAKKIKKVVIITNAGGPGVMTIDALASSNLELSKLSSKTNNKLKARLPAEASIINPVDLIGDAKADRYSHALDTILADKNVDAAIVILTPQTVTQIPETANLIVKNSKKYKKPILSSFIGGQKIKKGVDILEKNNLPVFNFPEAAVNSLEKFSTKSKTSGPLFKLNIAQTQKNKIRRKIEKAKKQDLIQLNFLECINILKIYQIPVIKSVLATSPNQALAIGKRIKGPLVMKAVAPKLIHKTDAGGVMVNIDPKESAKAYNQIKNNLSKKSVQGELDGIIIQPMIKSGQEVILGLKQDPSFGPVVAFGLGGIFVEVLKDINFRVAPLTKNDAKEMIQDLKSYKLLKGLRGQKGANIKAIENIILKLSQLGQDFPEIKEMDINPAFVDDKGLVVVDVRILI